MYTCTISYVHSHSHVRFLPIVLFIKLEFLQVSLCLAEPPTTVPQEEWDYGS